MCASDADIISPFRGITTGRRWGQALEFYTPGNYATMDVHLVSARRTEIAALLEGWGFDHLARHWICEDLDIAIEIPDDVLAGLVDQWSNG